MHIEPGLVADGKLWLSYLTAEGAAGYGLRLAWRTARDSGVLSLGLRSAAATALLSSRTGPPDVESTTNRRDCSTTQTRIGYAVEPLSRGRCRMTRQPPAVMGTGGAPADRARTAAL